MGSSQGASIFGPRFPRVCQSISCALAFLRSSVSSKSVPLAIPYSCRLKNVIRYPVASGIQLGILCGSSKIITQWDIRAVNPDKLVWQSRTRCAANNAYLFKYDCWGSFDRELRALYYYLFWGLFMGCFANQESMTGYRKKLHIGKCHTINSNGTYNVRMQSEPRNQQLKANWRGNLIIETHTMFPFSIAKIRSMHGQTL